ncbi:MULTISPECIES: hypothetical protein [Deefgea]|uniref:LysR family transcriptional regulator n=1 Tax=Deefgea chitinilytica TaxID=570276 RepID=A0ABS2CEV2_9NEIS|nr:MULTISPECIES: hypothetical protein [Deefgea]MBM5572675.1 hypothetical protein [Deefgea chitinilytica]MBM9889911.1 hypothetical protein [Deefgea sp. CFH1-16]
MSTKLTKDEMAALIEVSRGLKSTRLSHAVFKNVKTLTGQKLCAYERKTGILQITDLGKQTIFMALCIDALRQLKANPTLKVNGEALAFLLRKGHLETREGEVGHFITTKGEESLADIDSQK